jgi:phosphohistidine phosphatase
MIKRNEEEDDQKERYIVLLRHGIAEERTAAKPDEERGLTSEGHARMKQIARGLERAFPRAQAIYASPLVRAMQTALWVAKAYRSRVKVQTTDALVPGAGPAALDALLGQIPQRRIIVVGHEPNLTSNLVALIKARPGAAFELKKGGCYCVCLRPGGAVLEWMLSPRLLRRLGEES